MNKENDIKTAEEAIKLSKQAGISVTALLIIGNVGETEQTVDETIGFLKRTKPDEIGCVGGLWILPGTKLYQDCKRDKYIDDDFWLTNQPYKIYTHEYSFGELASMQKKVTKYHSMPTRIVNKIRKLMQ
jgi:coproporphyrinogen III oxidase-like Fe-S oxidoreductase